MEINNYSLIELKPSEGMWLTQVSDVDDSERIYSDNIFLGVGDSSDNWREATQEEKDEYDIRREKQLNEQLNTEEL